METLSMPPANAFSSSLRESFSTTEHEQGVLNCGPYPSTGGSPKLFLSVSPIVSSLSDALGPNLACISPTQSTVSQLTDLATVDSPELAAVVAGLEKHRCGSTYVDSDGDNNDAVYSSMATVIGELTSFGDLYWASRMRRRRMPVSTQAVANMIVGTVAALRGAGLLCPLTAVAATMYLRRLSSLDVKLVSHFTIHRYLVAASVIANKMCSDTYFPLQLYADACHTTRDVITSSEAALLSHLQYNVMVPPVRFSGAEGEFEATQLLLCSATTASY